MTAKRPTIREVLEQNRREVEAWPEWLKRLMGVKLRG